jgi:hypothetical protein
MSKFFLPYQVRWIKDPSRKRLMVKSRQIGISLATAYDMVLKTGEKPPVAMCVLKASGPGMATRTDSGRPVPPSNPPPPASIQTTSTPN